MAKSCSGTSVALHSSSSPPKSRASPNRRKVRHLWRGGLWDGKIAAGHGWRLRVVYPADEIQEIAPKITSALQDPSSASQGNTTDILKKQVPSHRNPVLCLRWLPVSIEIDRKIFYNLLQNTSFRHTSPPHLFTKLESATSSPPSAWTANF